MKMGSEYSIEEGLDELLSKIKGADFIIPIARRGIRILELSPTSQELFDKGKVLFYDAVKFHARELKSKRLILFDESVNTGGHLNRLRRNLRQFSFENDLNFDKRIFTAALLVNRDAKYYPDYYSKKLLLSNNLYDYLSDELHYKILSTGKPMDVDHLIVKIRLQENLIPAFISILHSIYHARELGHSGMYDDVKMYTIDFNLSDAPGPFPFKIPKIMGFLKLFDEGPKKIRVFLNDGEIYIVPIVYPAMEINKEIFKLMETCPLLDKMENRALCNVLKNAAGIKEDPALQSIVCYHCIVNELNVYLVSNFLIKLKQQIDFEFEGIDDKSIQVVSHHESKNVVNALEEKIKSSMENNEFITSIDGEIAEKCEFKGVSFDREVSTITGDYIKLEAIEDDERYESKLRPEIEISTAVERNEKVNNPLFDGLYKGTEKDPKGLSYYQIRKMMRGMDDLRFSEGMDVALDVGYLKPVTPFDFKGINVFCEGENHPAIVRLYSIASEDVGKSLSCFLSLITPKRE
jgi:hypothetical protein